MDEFARALSKVLISEGGYSDNPKDPGGATMKGVTQRVYDDWRRTRGFPIVPVRNISNTELEAIYREKYWNEIKGDQLAPGVSFVVFDGAVNSGVGQSVRWVQRALQAQGTYRGQIDGNLGPGTLLALKGVNDNDALVAAIITRRRAFLKALKTYKTFGRGWMARCDTVLAIGQAWATGGVEPETAFIEGGNAKALLSDAKTVPLASLGHVVAGTGAGGLGVTAWVDSAKDKLQQFAGGSQFIDHALMYMTLASLGLGGVGGAYGWYMTRASAARVDALDLDPQQSAVPA